MFFVVVFSLKDNSRDSVLSLAFVLAPLGHLRRIVRSRLRHRTVCCNCLFHRRQVRGRSRPSRGAPPAWTGRSCAPGWGSVGVTGSGLGPGAGRACRGGESYPPRRGRSSVFIRISGLYLRKLTYKILVLFNFKCPFAIKDIKLNIFSFRNRLLPMLLFILDDNIFSCQV